MRTRRIAIRCRVTGRSATVAIGTTGTGLPADSPVTELPPGLAVPPGYESLPGLDLPPLYGAPASDLPLDPPPGHAAPPADRGAPPADRSASPADRGAPPADRGASPAGRAVPPPAFTVPDYLADPGPAAPAGPVARGAHINRAVNPYRSNRGPDLTLADILARPGRRDLDWDRNPGWPASLGWAYIARAARGPSPRHARGGGWQVPGPALVWTGLGLLATAVLMLVAELLR